MREGRSVEYFGSSENGTTRVRHRVSELTPNYDDNTSLLYESLRNLHEQKYFGFDKRDRKIFVEDFCYQDLIFTYKSRLFDLDEKG